MMTWHSDVPHVRAWVKTRQKEIQAEILEQFDTAEEASNAFALLGGMLLTAAAAAFTKPEVRRVFLESMTRQIEEIIKRNTQ